MRIDELYSKLNHLNFIENYYVVNKKTSEDPVSDRILKIYDEETKLAEVSLKHSYMIRTLFPGFQSRNMLERQALLKILVEFAATPVDKRQSDLYFAYYNDLNHIPHFIKRLGNHRLADDMIPIAYFKTITEEQLSHYLFNTAEFEEFPEDYRPRFSPDSFVKVRSYEEMMQDLSERFPEKE